jgi:hypothetical protein
MNTKSGTSATGEDVEGRAAGGRVEGSPRSIGEGEEGAVTDDLERAFSLYFEEIIRCRASGLYLALLHLLVALPDVCAALEDDHGRTSNDRYKAWARYFGTDPRFTPEDRYALRCAVLHQGKTTMDMGGQYRSYSILLPSTDLVVDLVPDFDGGHYNYGVHVDELISQTRTAIRAWFADVQTEARRRQNVERHLPGLARYGKKIAGGISITAPTLSSIGQAKTTDR